MLETRRDGGLATRQLADFVADAVLATDRDNRVTYWNDAAERLFGWSAAEVHGRPAFKFFEVSFKSTTQAEAIRQIAETGRWSGIITQLTKDGRTLTCEAIVALLPGEEGRVVVLRDLAERQALINERLEAERGLRTSQEELRKLSRAIEQSSSSIVITDRAGDIEYVNPSFSAMSGYAPGEVIGRNPRVFKSGETSADTYRDLWSAITAGRTWRGELHNKGKSGELYWVRATISPIFGDAGLITHFVAIEENINAQKAAEDAARESERRYVSAQRMEAVGQLAGGIAHDFNNLLTAILGYSELVLDAIATNDGPRRDVEEIKKAGERAARLTRQLLAFSRKQRLEPQNMNLNHIVDDLAKMMARMIGEHIRMDVTTDEALGLAKLDAGQTEQIVMNLVINARDAMPDGGRLSVGTANVELDEEFVRAHPGAQSGSYVALTISDTGTGMSPAVVARIFEPFFTTKAPGQGTGLGLATVYGIVKQSNGYISVDSQVGAGTTFSIYFPRLSADTVATGTKMSSEAPTRGTETILVAEDESGLREVIARSLTRYGYTVLLASDGLDALEVESHHAGRIDLLLSDVVMREVGGPEVAQRLLRRRPTIKVLFMSGFDPRSAGRISAVDPGAAFLSKPFTPAGLARKVREVLDREGQAAGNGHRG